MLKRVLAYGIVLSAAASVIWRKFLPRSSSPQSSPPESISDTPADRDLDFTLEQQAILAAMRQQLDESRNAATVTDGDQPILKN